MSTSNDRGSRARANAGAGSKELRKTFQLCRQVFECLFITMSALSDSALQDVAVTSVEPAPNASRLLVSISLSQTATSSIGEIYAAIERAKPKLRAEVAAAITRKRAPELDFIVVAPTPPTLPEVQA